MKRSFALLIPVLLGTFSQVVTADSSGAFAPNRPFVTNSEALTPSLSVVQQRSSQYLVLNYPSYSRNLPSEAVIQRVLSEMKNPRGEVIAYRVAGSRSEPNIILAADLKAGGHYGDQHPQLIPGESIAQYVTQASKGKRIEIGWGTLEASVRDDVSSATDKKNLADLISAAQKRPDYLQTQLGKQDAFALSALTAGQSNRVIDDVLQDDHKVRAAKSYYSKRFAFIEPTGGDQREMVRNSIRETVRESIEAGASK